jgi:hypothetical protein
MMCSFAILDEAALQVVKRVEKETGETVLAYDCFSPNTISEDKIGKIQAAEKELCRTLMAIKTEHSK